MKQKLVMLFILLGTISFFMGCQKEERFSSPEIEKSSPVIKIVDKQFFENNKELNEKLKQLSSNKFENEELSSRIV